MSGLACSPLLRALSENDADASAAWRAWRSSVQTQDVTWPEMQILPMLNGPRLEEWLVDDPDAGILKGIVRRAWSEAQIRLGVAREVVNCLTAAGCEPVTLIGAAGSYLRGLHSTAIRPILELRILVPRRHLALASSTLEAEGWQPRDQVPSGDAFDRTTHVVFSRNGLRLHLHWRVLRVEARRAAASEREFLSDHRIVEAIGTPFRILAPGHALIEALAPREETVDVLGWQADAALICRELVNPQLSYQRPVNWESWAVLAARYPSQVLGRIPELRALGLAIPELSQTALVWTGLLERAEAWRYAAGGWARRFTTALGKQ